MKPLLIAIISAVILLTGMTYVIYVIFKNHETSKELNFLDSFLLLMFILKIAITHPYKNHRFLTLFQTSLLYAEYAIRFKQIYIKNRTTYINSTKKQAILESKAEYVKQINVIYKIIYAFLPKK